MKRAIEIIRTWSADKIELIFLKIIFKYLLYFLVFSTVIFYVYIFNHSSTTYTKVLTIFLVFVILFILLSKLFTRLACESDEEFDNVFKYNNEEYDRNIIRLQVMKLAKGFNDLHGWFSDPEYLEEEIREYEEAEYYARQRKEDEDSFWEEMAAVGVTPEDVYD